MAEDALSCEITLPWCTSVEVVEVSAASLLSYTLTPLATRPSTVFTMLTPVAPASTDPAIFDVAVLFSVTVELLAAIAEFSSPAAVTLSIWLSRRGCLS